MKTVVGRIMAATALFLMAGLSFSGQLTVTDGLQLWLKANAGVQTSGTSVTNWLDQSGHGNNVSQNSAASQPALVPGALNGFPAIQFDGLDDRLKAADASGLDGGTGMTIFVMAKPFNAGTYPQDLVVKWDYGTHGSYAFELENSQMLFTFLNLSSGDGGSNYRFSNTTNSMLSEFSTLGLLYDGTQATDAARLRHFRNGDLLPDSGGGGTIAATMQDSPSPLTIGDFPNLNRHFDGQIAEVLLYNTALSAGDRQSVIDYLHAKYFLPPAGTVILLK